MKFEKKIENKKLDWRKYLLYTLSAAMLTAPLFVPGMVRAAEPESEYEKEGGQDKEESKKPVSWEFKDGVLTVSGEGEMPDYSGIRVLPVLLRKSSMDCSKGFRKKNCNIRGNYFHWKAEFFEF